MSIDLYHITLTFILLLLVIELNTGSGMALAASIGLIPVVLMHIVFDDFNFSRDVFTFSITSIITYFLMRKFFRKKSDVTKSVDDDINTY